MYAVKKGHVEVVKCLMKCTDLDLWIKNRVSDILNLSFCQFIVIIRKHRNTYQQMLYVLLLAISNHRFLILNWLIFLLFLYSFFSFLLSPSFFPLFPFLHYFLPLLSTLFLFLVFCTSD